MNLFKPILIPRQTIKAYQTTVTKDDYGIPTQSLPVEIILNDASSQPVSGQERNALPEGLRDSNIQKVFSSTFIDIETEGEDTTTYFVLDVFPDKKFNLVKSKPWRVGVQSHCEYIVVEQNER